MDGYFEDNIECNYEDDIEILKEAGAYEFITRDNQRALYYFGQSKTLGTRLAVHY